MKTMFNKYRRIILGIFLMILVPNFSWATSAVQVEFLASGVKNSSGKPLSSGKVYTYEAGTTTDKACWTDASKIAMATNPIILDSWGQATVYCDGNYKFVIKTSGGTTVRTLDNFYYFGSMIISSSSSFAVNSVTTNYTASAYNQIIKADATAGVFTITLPTAVGIAGTEITVLKMDGTVYHVVVMPSGSEKINGQTSVSVYNQYSSMKLISDGANWTTNNYLFNPYVAGTMSGASFQITGFDDIYSSDWTDWSSSFTVGGFSSTTSKQLYYKKIGKLIFINFYVSGTSNSSSGANNYIMLPAVAKGNTYEPIKVMDNGSYLTTPGLISISGSTQQGYITKDYASGTFTASGTKTWFGNFSYVTLY
jgi:hypothetical protein